MLSTFLSISAIAGTAVLFSSVTPRATLAQPTFASSHSDVETPLGLSRRRGAFNYAIDTLANASGMNPSLSGYYHDVASRLAGQPACDEEASGIHIIQPGNVVNASAASTTSVGSAATFGSSLFAVLASAMSLAKGPTLPSFYLMENAANAEVSTITSTQNTETRDSSTRFTVGDIAFEVNSAVEYWVNYYTSTPQGRRTMTIGIQRSNEYLEMAREEFRKAGVPEDLVWLAFVESVWNPKAISPAAAGGIWQFIRPTATDYGLKVESGCDERGDPLKQTRVAAVYLRDLHTIFGDWALAMAAYNSGEPRVMGAIVKNGRADFWDLCDKQLLPKETRDYVPKILAAIKIAGHAEDYGLVSSTTASQSGS